MATEGNICIGDKTKLYALCTSNSLNKEYVTITIEYDYFFDIIFKNTSLPKVLVKLICKWINDEVILEFTDLYDDKCPYCEKKLSIQTIENTYINCVETKFEFKLFFCAGYFATKEMCYIRCNDNIIKYIDSIPPDFVNERSLYEKTVESNFKNTNRTYPFLKIVNYNVWIIICKIVHTLHNNVKQIIKKN